LVQAQAVIQRPQRKLDDVSMLTDVLQEQGNGVLLDMMSNEDQMVLRHVLGLLKKGGGL